MDSHKFSAQVERLEVVDTGRQRRWSEDEKLKVVLESLQTPQVSSTARRYPANALVGPLRRPIPLPARAPLVTLQDAAAYITALPNKEADTAEWQSKANRIPQPAGHAREFLIIRPVATRGEQRNDPSMGGRAGAIGVDCQEGAGPSRETRRDRLTHARTLSDAVSHAGYLAQGTWSTTKDFESRRA
jgi:hypothetical protein